MKKLGIVLIATVMCVGVTGVAMAANSDNITVNYTVSAINEVNIDDASISLTISTATPGQQPDSATASTTYDITTNESLKKLTGILDSAMPAGLTLRSNATAPTGGVSAGWTELTAVAADLVTSIETVAQADIAWDFSLNGGVTTGPTSGSRTCTLTLTDE